MEMGKLIMATKLAGNFQGIFSLGEEIVGPLEKELTVGGSMKIMNYQGWSGIVSSTIEEIKKTGNVYLVKTRNSIYLVQPM